MLGKYVFDANCIIFVYDVTNLPTFESVTDWVTVIKKLTNKQERVGE
jgi:GTPase SAR1 family protein